MNSKSTWRKHVLLFAVVGLVGRLGWSQDIIRVYSDAANTTYTASGSTVDIKIRLYGNFALRNAGGTPALYPQLRMVVNGDVAWAELYTLSTESGSYGYKTYAVFRYTIKPGDMANPLKIYGLAGTGGSDTDYQFYWNGWEIYNQSTGSNAVWQMNTDFTEMALTANNLNLASQKIGHLRRICG